MVFASSTREPDVTYAVSAQELSPFVAAASGQTSRCHCPVFDGGLSPRLLVPPSTGMGLLERGRLREAHEVFWQEVETASADGDIEMLAEAALGLGGIWVHEHRTTLDNARVAALQRQALEALPHDHALARRLRMRLAAERAYRSATATTCSRSWSVLAPGATRLGWPKPCR